MRQPWHSTSVRSGSKKARLLETIAARGWTRIGEAEWNALLAAIPKLTAGDLRDVGVPVEVPWSGVLQKTFAELENSLGDLAEVYAVRPDLRRFCRAQVIRAKDRARWASRNARVPLEKRAVKTEMVEWMLVWLGDPALFRQWAQIRRTRMTQLEPNLLSIASWTNTG
jgi:hypothetical protein